MSNKQLFKNWIESNPLRKFRKSQGFSIMEVASILGVGMSTIQTWESGAHWPKDENFDRMGAFMEVTNLEQKWSQWLKAKPTLNSRQN